MGFVQGRKIFALQIFNERDFKRFAVFQLLEDNRDLVNLRQLRGAPAAFTGDNFKGALFFRVLAYQ